MTNLMRSKCCHECKSWFTERAREANSDWLNRRFCGIRCHNINMSKSRRVDISERLASKQIKNGSNECWGWSGAKDNKGYGIVSNRNGRNKSPEKAHRISYEITYGEIPIGQVVRHKCDNPECTNPSHLELGTQKENMQDCSLRGRLNPKSIENLVKGAKGFHGAATETNRIKHG